MSLYHVNGDDIKLSFKQGYAETEILSGVYEGVRTYRCVLKAGNTVNPQTYDRAHQVLIFQRGQGYVTTPAKAYNITEVSTFIANLDEEFAIHASTDLMFTKFVVDLTHHDMEVYEEGHINLPLFKNFKDGMEYYQSCKSEHTRSWSILVGGQLNRTLYGLVSSSEGGTKEKGHSSVAQWNVILDDSELTLTVEDESVDEKGGDVSFVCAGDDHSLVAKPGKHMNYIWFEHYVQEIDYIVKNPR